MERKERRGEKGRRNRRVRGGEAARRVGRGIRE